jgi:hypothetical protein
MAAINQQRQADLERQYDELYETYGTPLEAQHAGEYLAISPDGKTLLGHSLHEIAEQAEAAFGLGNFLYKIGPKAVGRLARRAFARAPATRYNHR